MADDDPLRVLDAARRFGEMVAEMTQRLPRRAPAGLRGQLAKAAAAVSGLLSEGFGRRTNGEKIHYSLMANGSLEESQDDLKKTTRCFRRALLDALLSARAHTHFDQLSALASLHHV